MIIQYVGIAWLVYLTIKSLRTEKNLIILSKATVEISEVLKRHLLAQSSEDLKELLGKMETIVGEDPK
jgi:threonine/homoserine/homoserine lactone efflux protein